ncbi:MAG: hypothetical protein ACREO5_00800, partial [Candidatus Binatia bacterium]
MPNESIHPEKLLLLVAAIPTLRLEVNQFGERRRRFEEQIRNLQALRKSPSEVHNKASIDQQTADLQRRRAEIESEFSAAFDAFNDAGKLAENCRQYLQKQDIPLPESQPAGSSSQLPQMSARSPTTKGKEELATVRSKIVEIVDMVDALKSCPPPAAVLIEKQIAAIDNVQHRLFIDDLVTRGDTTSILIAIHAAELKQALTTY